MTKWFSPDKRKLFKQAIHTTKDAGDLISLSELQHIIMMIKAIPKLDTAFNANIKGITMKKWPEIVKDIKEKKVIFDEKSFADALQTMLDRHDDLKHCKANVLDEAKAIQSLLGDSEFKLNHVQLATSMLAYQHTKVQQRQMWVVPAGQGKSRIHAALTLALLKYTKQSIYVVF